MIEADAGTVTPLTQWPDGAASELVPEIPPTLLNVHAGGPAWTQCYDAALGRCSFYDDLADLGGIKVEGDAVAYLVTGWWSASADDPLNGVGTDLGYRHRLDELGWNDPDHPSTDEAQRATSDDRYRVAETFGLPATQRYSPTAHARRRQGGRVGAVRLDKRGGRGSAARPERLPDRYRRGGPAAAAPTRTTLLHGRFTASPSSPRWRRTAAPAPTAMRVVLGSSTPDLAATVTVAGAGIGTADQDARRSAERLLAAFSSGLLMRINEANTWADIDEYEHAHGFISLPGGTEGVDRFVDKPVKQ